MKNPADTSKMRFKKAQDLQPGDILELSPDSWVYPPGLKPQGHGYPGNCLSTLGLDQGLNAVPALVVSCGMYCLDTVVIRVIVKDTLVAATRADTSYLYLWREEK